MDDRPQPGPAHPGQPRLGARERRIIRVVDEPRTPSNLVAFDEPPVARILAVVTVVSQDEVTPGRNDQGPLIIPSRLIPTPLRRDEVVRLPFHVGMRRVSATVDVPHIRLIDEGAVAVQLLVPHLEGV